MSRRKSMIARQPNGQPRRIPELMSPTEVRRLVDASGKGMRDSVWDSRLGELMLRQKISAVQYAAGRRWVELGAQYSIACGSPAPPRSGKLERGGGEAADPASVSGTKEARRHVRTVQAYLTAERMLQLTGKVAEGAVRDVCDRDLYPAGLLQLDGLCRGLTVLAVLWETKA